MNRLKRITPIAELAENKEKLALQAFGQGQQRLDEARKALNSLRSFRENYAALFSQSGNKGLNVRQMHEYRAFLARLNVAIAEQERVVQSAEADLQLAKQAWEDAHSRALGMQKVVEKLRVEEARREQTREQLEQDERASRRGAGAKSLSTVFI